MEVSLGFHGIALIVVVFDLCQTSNVKGCRLKIKKDMYCSAQSPPVVHKNGSFNWFFNETKQATPGKKKKLCYDNCTLTYIFLQLWTPFV